MAKRKSKLKSKRRSRKRSVRCPPRCVKKSNKKGIRKSRKSRSIGKRKVRQASKSRRRRRIKKSVKRSKKKRVRKSVKRRVKRSRKKRLRKSVRKSRRKSKRKYRVETEQDRKLKVADYESKKFGKIVDETNEKYRRAKYFWQEFSETKTPDKYLIDEIKKYFGENPKQNVVNVTILYLEYENYVVEQYFQKIKQMIYDIKCITNKLYCTLNVYRDSSLGEITKSYHNLLRKYHPDKAKSKLTQGEAKVNFQALYDDIKNAYEVLKDVSKRKTYDDEQKELFEDIYITKLVSLADIDKIKRKLNIEGFSTSSIDRKYKEMFEKAVQKIRNV